MIYFFIEIHMENQVNDGNQNTQQIGQNPISQPVQIPEKPKVNYLLIGLVILGCFVIFGIGGYYLGTQKTSQNSKLPVPSPTSTEAVSPTNILAPTTQPSVITNGWIKFTHPAVGYSFDYPGNWKGGIQEIPEAIKQDYQDFNIESSDHRISEGYPVLEQGAEIFVRAEKTTRNSIDDIFDSDPLAQDIASNKTFTTVDGQRAIQYDYSYEGHVATMTIFTKNGIYYTVKFRYVDKNGKEALWNDYVKLLTSFRIK